MFFSYESAWREMKRANDCGGRASMSKRWYGWVVVDDPVYEIEKPQMKMYVLLYPKPACLRIVAEQAARYAPNAIITKAQIDQYIKFLAGSAFKLEGYICLKVVCDVLPKAYMEPAEEIFVADDQNNLTSFKSRHAKKDAHHTAYVALHEVYPKLTLTTAAKKEG
jgi:hypothetical protein